VRFVLCGKNDAAVESLGFLVEKGNEVLAIGVAGDEGRDGWQRSLKRAAETRGIPFEQPGRINDPAFVDRLRAFAPDALISIQYDQILKNILLQGLGAPCLNIHFALLPRHRGVSPIAWAVYDGDAKAGATLHHMVEDIDAGDLIAQRAASIAPDDTAREVYDKVSDAAAGLFRECYPFPPSLLEQRLPQSDERAVYHRAGDFDFSKRRIDWLRPADELHRWIRAMIFPPLQYPEAMLGGRLFQVTRLNALIGPPAPLEPGSVVARSAELIDVAARDGVIRITGIREASRPDATIKQALSTIALGDRFT
jgi:methionyl-tRNA formyltransferase